jgi:glutamate N-acetyltransferase/amino-acid N-acetyltransferase
MALLATEDRQPVACAAVFTQNKFAAPPVELGRKLLAANRGRVTAVVVNSGNANAGTGAAGYKDAQLMARRRAMRSVRREPGSRLLDRDHRHAAADGAHPSRHAEACEEIVGRGWARRSPRHPDDGPQSERSPDQGSTFTIGGMAKGCGMIAPNMATMLAFLTTDADVPRELIQNVLRQASDATFNTLNVDGATSPTTRRWSWRRAGAARPTRKSSAMLCSRRARI